MRAGDRGGHACGRIRHSGQTKTSFLVTVDVETRSQGDPAADVMGVLPGATENLGIERIMELLEANHARGTFFLNAYEVAAHGEETMAGAARLIHARGHDLELHTHPRPMYCHYGMSKAPLDKQIEILEKGMLLIEGWTGKRVVAHRAGAFAANVDTLRAAETVGLRADCSLSPGSRVDVPLVDEIGPANRVRRVGGIWEIPVTWFYQLRLGPWRSRRILDIEGCSLAEIKCVTRWAIRHRMPTVCILMHSFSFSRNGRPNLRVIRRFSALLEWLRGQAEIEVQTVEWACERLAVEAMPEAGDEATATGSWLTWRRALGAWNDGWKNVLVSAAGFCLLGVVVLAIVVLSRMAMQR